MVLLPEERGMTLAELRQIAACQQHQIEAQQQLLVAKEQRLKFLKQQEARHHGLAEQQRLDNDCLLQLRDKVEMQELKLRQLRALRGQVEQQKTNNSNLGAELESIRALFCEKEKELDLAVTRVEELTRQLDDIKKNNNNNGDVLLSTCELENLRRELLYRTKLSEQQNHYICQQRDKIGHRQQEIFGLDQKINELHHRLQRKRLLNEQYASQIHLESLSCTSHYSNLSSGILAKNEASKVSNSKTRTQEILDRDHTQDDLAARLQHKCDFGEFSLTKNDPKYQTLPYNTKFTLKEKQSPEDSLSSSTEDESWTSNEQRNAKSFSNMCHFSPRPFNTSFVANSGVQKVTLQISSDDASSASKESEVATDQSIRDEISSRGPLETNGSTEGVETATKKPPKAVVKPAVPPKPALSVKPMLVPKRKDVPPPESDSVSMALTFLKNKSSEKEKSDFSNYRERLLYYQCVPRYSRDAPSPAPDPLLPKSRILTYFSKTLLQPEGGATDDPVEVPSRKRHAFGQLPIKPKPLTIRKHPGIEPPRLKAQSSAAQRKEQPPKATRSVPPSEEEIVPPEPVPPPAAQVEWGDEAAVPSKSEVDAVEQSSVSESASEGEKSDRKETTTEEPSSEEVDRCVVAKKGNLKGGEEGGGRGCSSRRVSFDPLALLLDAALEGELELVRKIANEVVNPSAANDEGITALHNAICAGQFDVVQFLVEFGCDVNAPDSDGWTPLHCAASCNNLSMVKFLVERGACVFATTLSDQETAAEKCEEDGAGFDSCSEYLFGLQDQLGGAGLNGGTVFAVYDYDSQQADELSFRSGDALSVLRRSDDEEDEWWWCRLSDREGYVPRNLLGLYPRVAPSNGEPISGNR